MSKTLLVPDGWGEKPEEMNIGNIFAFGGSVELAEAENKAEHELNSAIRTAAQKAGFVIKESPNFKDATSHNEYTFKGASISDKEELEFIEKQIPEVNLPKRCSWEEYSSMPFFPVVARKDGSSMGKDKYLLDTKEQWKKFEICATRDKLEYPDNHPWKDYPIDHNGSIGKEDFFMQEFIECPSDHYTSYRIMVSCTGEIICAGLLYSGNKKNDNVRDSKPMDAEYFWDNIGYLGKQDFLNIEHSPVFLNARKIISNRAQGGGGIVLNSKQNSLNTNDLEKQILVDHGLNPNNPKIPDEIEDFSKKIATIYGKRKGLFVGIDWIQGVDGKFHYLETNFRPGLQTYADFAYNGKYEQSKEESISLYTEIYSKVINSITSE